MSNNNTVLIKNTYQAIADVLKDSTRLDYIGDKDVFLFANPSILDRKHAIFMYPMTISNLPTTESDSSVNISYIVVIGVRVNISTNAEENLMGSTNKKGLMDLLSDIYYTIKDDQDFSINSQGTSVSGSNSSTSYVLTSSARYLTIQIDDLNMNNYSGYTTIDCGTSTLSGTTIASTIQTSIRALALTDHPADPYATTTCTYDTDRKKFTITSPTVGTRSVVKVTAGASNDASVILKFGNKKIETRGTNVIVSRISTAFQPPEEEYLPSVYGRIEIYIEEEIYFE